jgi:hypothetical protein
MCIYLKYVFMNSCIYYMVIIKTKTDEYDILNKRFLLCTNTLALHDFVIVNFK